jgi:chemotaxis protein CheX
MSTTTLDSTTTAQVINPLISATIDTFEKMIQCRPMRTGLTLSSLTTPKQELNAVISLTGKIYGTIILSISTETACEIYNRLTGDEAHEIDESVRDAVGEVCNMIAGASKAQLEVLQLRLGLPNVIQGKDVMVHYPASVDRPMCLIFSSEIGEFTIEAGFAPNLNSK